MSSPTTSPLGSSATCTATRAACAAPRGYGRDEASGVFLGKDARIAAVAPIGRGPVDHHDDAVAEVDEEVDVRDQPDEPGDEARQMEAAEHRHGRGAPDGGELAVVAIAERL